MNKRNSSVGSMPKQMDNIDHHNNEGEVADPYGSAEYNKVQTFKNTKQLAKLRTKQRKYSQSIFTGRQRDYKLDLILQRVPVMHGKKTLFQKHQTMR